MSTPHDTMLALATLFRAHGEAAVLAGLVEAIECMAGTAANVGEETHIFEAAKLVGEAARKIELVRECNPDIAELADAFEVAAEINQEIEHDEA